MQKSKFHFKGKTMITRILLNGMLFAGVLLLASCNRSQVDPASETVATTSEQKDEQLPLVGKPAPDVESELLDGSKFSLKEQYGKGVVLLDFWATWCGPCVEELPILMKVAEEYRDQGVVLYAVNQQEDPKDIGSFLERMGWKLNVVLDPESKHGDAYGVSGIPQLVIIGRDGTVRKVHVGYAPEIEGLLRTELDAILKSSAPGKAQ